MTCGGGKFQAILWGAMIGFLGGNLYAAAGVHSRIVSPVLARPVLENLVAEKMDLSQHMMVKPQRERPGFERLAVPQFVRVTSLARQTAVEEIYRHSNGSELERFPGSHARALRRVAANGYLNTAYRMGRWQNHGRDLDNRR